LRYRDPLDPFFSGNIPYAKLVLRNMVGRRDLKSLAKIAKTARIDFDKVKTFRAGRGSLSTAEFKRLTQTILYGLAEYHPDTDTLVSSVKQG
jgi:hypothetical protein